MDRIDRYPARSAVRAVHQIPKDSKKTKGTLDTAQKIALTKLLAPRSYTMEATTDLL
jgi:hypothetical protein